MAGPDDETEAPSADPLVGSELDGRYLITAPIGSGGMGDIYEGKHLGLGRRVAVKVLSETFARNDEAVRRFQREARASSRIEHPHIVDILDLGRLESGEPYLVMELLEGEDLAELVAREAPLPPRRVLELLAPVASALDAVHAQGLLHRDIKPGNVFLARHPGGEVVPKLLDFGLAALRDAPEEERLTREGIVVGTPHYVSPEAAEGEAVDGRTDVYSLAVVAFELLSGVLPFDGHRPMSLLYAKVRRPAPTLAERTDRAFDPALQRLIGRSLSRTPSHRPGTCGELVEQLREIVERLPLDATHVDLPRADAAPRPNDDTPRVTRSEPLSVPLHRLGDRRSFAVATLLLLAGLLAGWAWLIDGGGPSTAAGRTAPAEAGRTEASRTEDVEPGPTLDSAEVPADVPADDPAEVATDVRTESPASEPAEALAAGPSEPTSPALSGAAAAPVAPALAPRAPRAAGRSAAAEREPGSPERNAAGPAADARPTAAEEPNPPGNATSPASAPAAAVHAPEAPLTDLGEPPDRAAALTRRAGVALLRGQFPRARQLYREATYADAEHAPAWRGLGLASERMGMSPEAVRAYRRYLRLASGGGDAAQVRARIAALSEAGE